MLSILYVEMLQIASFSGKGLNSVKTEIGSKSELLFTDNTRTPTQIMGNYTTQDAKSPQEGKSYSKPLG